MILVDTSAWIEYLRGTGSPAHLALRTLVADGGGAVTEPVIMEVLAGARSRAHEHQLRGVLARLDLLPVAGADFVEAAFLYRLCRANGSTIRSQVDCLIAAVAIRSDVPVLHADRDFGELARLTAVESRSS